MLCLQPQVFAGKDNGCVSLGNLRSRVFYENGVRMRFHWHAHFLFKSEKKMLNELKNKVVRGEDITVEEARRLAENPLKEELYDAAHELTVK